MARIRRKKALYEVINRKRSKVGDIPVVEPLHPERSDKPQMPKAENQQKPARTLLSWPAKPKIMQFNAGRIEISIPVQLAVAIVLAIVLIALVSFRLGQWSHSVSTQPAKPTTNAANPTVSSHTPIIDNTPKTPDASAMKNRHAAATATANNVIVLVQHDRYADLQPVQQHFAAHGVVTQIVTKGAKYFLVTRKRYDKFTPGTKGYNDLKRIRQIGAKYKAPPGRETFAAHLFSDAYGCKIWF